MIVICLSIDGPHPVDQPDITGIVPVSEPVLIEDGQSTVRMQTQSSTSMLMGSVDRNPLQGVWGPRQRSEPPTRYYIPPQQTIPVQTWQTTSVQRSSQQIPTGRPQMSQSYPSATNVIHIDGLSPAQTFKPDRPPSQGRPSGWEPVQAPQQSVPQYQSVLNASLTSTPGQTSPQVPATSSQLAQAPATPYQPAQQPPQQRSVTQYQMTPQTPDRQISYTPPSPGIRFQPVPQSPGARSTSTPKQQRPSPAKPAPQAPLTFGTSFVPEDHQPMRTTVPAFNLQQSPSPQPMVWQPLRLVLGVSL